MIKHLPLGLFATTVLSFSAIASVAALNGDTPEPVSTDTPTATAEATDTVTPTDTATPEPTETETPAPSPTDMPTETPAPSPTDAAVCDDDDDDEADDDHHGDDADDDDDADHHEGDDADDDSDRHDGDDDHCVTAQAIADAFGVPVEEVQALHDQGFGFGIIFKAYRIAAATGQNVQDVLASFHDDDDHDDSWGQQFHDLSDEEHSMDDLPRNLGQAVSGNQSHHH